MCDTLKNQVLKNVVIFNTEHMGALLKMVVLRLSLHPNDRSVLIVKNSNGRDRLFRNLLKYNIFDCILTHDGRIGMKSKTEEQSAQIICSYFDELLACEGLVPENISVAYTAHDCDNPFGVYLHLKGIPQTIVEISPRQFNNDNVYNTTCNKRKSSVAYAELQKKTKCLNGGTPEYTLFRYDLTSPGTYVDYELMISRFDINLKNNVIASMLDGGPELNKAQVLLANSYAFNRYIPLPEFQKGIAYQIIADYILSYDKTLVIKPHPEGLDVVNGLFPPEIILDGSIPIDVIKLVPNIHMSTVVTVASSSLRQFESICDKTVQLGMTYFENISLVNLVYAVLRMFVELGKIRQVKQDLFSVDFIDALLCAMGAPIGKSGVNLTINKEIDEFYRSCREDTESIHIYLNYNNLDVKHLPADIQQNICSKIMTISRTDITSVSDEGISSFFVFTDRQKLMSKINTSTFTKDNIYSKNRLVLLRTEVPNTCYILPIKKSPTFTSNSIPKDKVDFDDAFLICSRIGFSQIGKKELDALVSCLESRTYDGFTSAVMSIMRYDLNLGNKSLLLPLVKLVSSMGNKGVPELIALKIQYPTCILEIEHTVTMGQYFRGELDLNMAIQTISDVSEKSPQIMIDYANLLNKRNTDQDMIELQSILDNNDVPNGALHYNLALYRKKLGDTEGYVRLMRKSKEHNYWRANNELINALIASENSDYISEGLNLFNYTLDKSAGNYYAVGRLMLESSVSEERESGIKCLECGAKMGNRNCISLLRKARGV